MGDGPETIADQVRAIPGARIGVFVGTPGLGDLVTEIPLYETLRNEFPDAELYWIGKILSAWQEFFETYFPEARTFPYELVNRPRDIWWNLRQSREARKMSWDLILDTQRHFVHSYIIKRFGAKWTIGYSSRSVFSDVKIKDPKKTDPTILGNLLTLVKAIGIPEERIVRKVRLQPTEEALNLVKETYGSENKAMGIGLAPWGTQETKRWPPSHWWELGKRLREKGLEVFWFAGPGERDFLRECVRMVPGSRAPVLEEVRFAEITNTLGVLAQMQVVVANNNGITHLASGMGIPTAIIFGPTRPDRHKACGSGPLKIIDRAERCSPCRYTRVHDCPWEHICMRGVTPDEVLEAIREWLERLL